MGARSETQSGQKAADYVIDGSKREVNPRELSIDDWVHVIRLMLDCTSGPQQEFVLSRGWHKPIKDQVGFETKIRLPACVKPDSLAVHIGFVGKEKTNKRGYEECWSLFLVKQGLLLCVYTADKREPLHTKNALATFRMVNSAKELARMFRFQEQFWGVAFPPPHIGVVILNALENILEKTIKEERERLTSREETRALLGEVRSRLKSR